MSIRFLLFVSYLLITAWSGCGPGLPARDNDATFAGKGGDLNSPDEIAGVIAFVNDPGVTLELLDRSASEGGVGLDRRAATNIVAGRPFVDFAALDETPYVGVHALAALRDFACDVRGLCEPDLTIATWNIRTFPMADGSVEAVARELEELDADVIAVQEIADAEAFDELLDLLPDHDGVQADRGWYTGVGLIFRRATVEPLVVTSLFTSDPNAFPRPVLLFKAKIGSRPVTFLVVHLKAQINAASQKRRRAACDKLAAFLEGRPDEEVVVLGDWNDRLDDAGEDNVFEPLLSSPQQYSFLTASLVEPPAEFSYLGFHTLIDHILVTDEVLAGRKVSTSITHLDQTVADYEETISDHLPVISTLTVR